MAFDFRYPTITGATEKEQLQQLKTYIHQLVDELKWALNSADSAQGNYVVIKQKQVNANSGISTIGMDELDDDSVQAHFNEIKPLIIKSADIVNAYYEVINKRLESLYLAQSDFGTFAEKTTQDIEATSKDITQVFGNVQTIAQDVSTIVKDVTALDTNFNTMDGIVKNIDVALESVETDLQDTKVGIDSAVKLINDEVGVIDSDLQGVKAGVESNIKDLSDEVLKVDSKLEDAKSAIDSDIDKLKKSLDILNEIIVDVNAHIKSGIIDHDKNGIPIYGLEIGQKNTINGVEVFNKYARFSAGKLSFFDNNGIEVAYISDYKLYITHAEVTGTLKLGGYIIDTSKGVTFKWVGRS